MQTIAYILFSLPPLVIFVCTLVMYHRNERTGIRKSLFLLLFVVAFTMLLYAQYFNPLLTARHSWGVDFLYCLLSPFCAPVYFLFLDRLTHTHKSPTVNVIAFLPAIIYAAMLITAQMFMTPEERTAYVCNEIEGHITLLETSSTYNWMVIIGKRVFRIFVPAQTLLTILYGLFRLNTYEKLLVSYYTTKDVIYVNRVSGLKILTILIVATCLLIMLIPVYETFNQMWIVLIGVVVEIVMVLIMAVYVMKIQFTARDLIAMMSSQSIDSSNKPDNGKTTDGGDSAPVRYRRAMSRVATASGNGAPTRVPTLIERADMAMRKDKLYLKADLSIVELAEIIGTNRTYLSKAIRDTKGCNFSDYVNRYRLDYALGLMKESSRKNLLIQNIAVQCGCGSVQTFYRYFKLFYNITPTQWIEENKMA